MRGGGSADVESKHRTQTIYIRSDQCLYNSIGMEHISNNNYKQFQTT